MIQNKEDKRIASTFRGKVFCHHFCFLEAYTPYLKESPFFIRTQLNGLNHNKMYNNYIIQPDHVGLRRVMRLLLAGLQDGRDRRQAEQHGQA